MSVVQKSSPTFRTDRNRGSEDLYIVDTFYNNESIPFVPIESSQHHGFSPRCFELQKILR